MERVTVWVLSKEGDGPMGTYRWLDDCDPPSEMYARLLAEKEGLKAEALSLKEFAERCESEWFPCK